MEDGDFFWALLAIIGDFIVGLLWLGLAAFFILSCF